MKNSNLQCDRTVSLNKYFDAISPPHPTVLGLLGCGCSMASTPVAEIIHHSSISQVESNVVAVSIIISIVYTNYY